MRVSIITVCLNCSEIIEETVKSIPNQDYRDIEYILVDSGSQDGTLDILSRYKTIFQNLHLNRTTEYMLQ